MDDDEIRDALGDVAPPPTPSTDNFEVILRRAGRGRARLLTVALVVALVAGPAAGVLIGLNIDHGKTPVTVASGSANDSRSGSAKSAAAPDTATASGSAVASGGFALAGGAKLVPLFVRTTADGIAVRAYRADVPVPTALPATGISAPPTPPTPPSSPIPPPVTCAKDAPCATGPATTAVAGASTGSTGGLPSAPVGSASGSATASAPGTPAAECFPEAILRAELSNQAAVEPGFLAVSKLVDGQALAVIQAGFFGVEEGSPAAWVAVHTSAAVTTVRVHFADGATDEMAPVQGYAVLAHQMSAPPAPDPSADPAALRKATLPTGTVEALDGSGAVVATADLASPAAPAAPCMVVPPVPAPAPDQLPPGAGAAPATAPAVTITPNSTSGVAGNGPAGPGVPAAPTPPPTTTAP